MPPPSPRQPDAARSSSAAPGNYDEGQDFGVRPTPQLRPSDQLHAPTPTAIPGGKVVGTRQLAAWLQGAEAPLLLHAIGSPVHLPKAVAAAPASQGGSFDDAVQREYGAFLEQSTRGDRGRLIVTYCQGVQCWGSYNAALRAIRLGYTNVHWYRGGMEAWQAAGLPLGAATRRSAGPGPPPR
ncbi:rhodanese-like domain-containing protein [Piscinibacter koreensis]|uniref:Sulfurtransferase n=1 Tax=Piscinibacter koreensis TaxID=2742824 RepID=A0A7Y6TYG7_9BURK|nr:rhodanese-like domain-containing protein [Schlegelella koreensis]NUZ08105.1 sulfurtransferase [Schlegelella koreensis]